MAIDILTVPCRADNYAFLIHNSDTGQTALVDAPETAPLMAALETKGWTLDDLLITHHHHDHVEAVEDLRAAFGCRVIGAAADAHRLPDLDLAVADGDSFETCGLTTDVFDVSGHTVGHVAFYMAATEAVFTADSLMALGCGRLFEGTPAQMWESLLRIRALPQTTTVYSGHEYTAANGRFAITIEPDNPDLIARIADIDAARDANQPTVPSSLALEIATNPFLRADLHSVQAGLDMAGDGAAEVFGEIRRRKDNF
ncbi:hydroxyacylglutathione hydrolase [Algirhabdus cladophorae]|uniref:hydroxyacylglutathione hydrolase n=1 Tax=Algirhabdus cladophorae TaxID=3377108 RepID=UPI003B845351